MTLKIPRLAQHHLNHHGEARGLAPLFVLLDEAAVSPSAASQFRGFRTPRGRTV